MDKAKTRNVTRIGQGNLTEGMNWEIWVNMMKSHFAIMIGLISLIGGAADDYQNSYATPQQYDDPSNDAPRIKSHIFEGPYLPRTRCTFNPPVFLF